MKRFCLHRHRGAVNGLFLDFSIRKIGLKGIWALKWRRRYNTAGTWTRLGGAQAEDWPEGMRGLRGG